MKQTKGTNGDASGIRTEFQGGRRSGQRWRIQPGYGGAMRQIVIRGKTALRSVLVTVFLVSAPTATHADELRLTLGEYLWDETRSTVTLDCQADLKREKRLVWPEPDGRVSIDLHGTAEQIECARDVIDLELLAQRSQ